MPRLHPMPIALLALAACSSAEDVRERTAVAPTSSASATASATSRSTGRAESVKEDSDLYSYEFSYPAPVGAHPELAAHLKAEAAKAKAGMIAEATAAKADARVNDYPYRPHSLGEEWQVVADLPGYLSLSNAFYTYAGGAHGMYGMKGYVWDKANRRGFASEELFRSPAALGAAIGKGLCAALNQERVKKGMEPEQEAGGVFPACPGVDEATVLVGSSNGKTFDRITVWYGPFVAGSYAEGAYELDFPLTAAMWGAVKPAYRAAFSAAQ